MTQQTARDLRTAAQVTEAAGHGKGKAASPETGRVCAVGALQIATGQSRLTAARHPRTGTTFFDLCFISSDSARLNAAVVALAPQLPDPCRECERDCGMERPEVTRLIHFNDHVCRGGDELQLLFVTGAEKIEADL